MKAVREKALDVDFVVGELQLTADEAARAQTLIHWLQCKHAWSKNRDSRSLEKQLGDALLAVEEDFPDYNRRMVLMNQLLSL